MRLGADRADRIKPSTLRQTTAATRTTDTAPFASADGHHQWCSISVPPAKGHLEPFATGTGGAPTKNAKKEKPVKSGFPLGLASCGNAVELQLGELAAQLAAQGYA